MDAICSGSSRKRSTPPLDDRQKTEQLILLLTQHQDDPQILEMASKMFDVLQANIPNINDINPLQVDEMQVDEFAPLDILETFPPILFAEKKNEDDFCLKNHQTEAISFLYKKVIGPLEAWKEQHSGSGAIIAHFMGLGKTTTIVAFLYGILSHPAFEKRIKRVLIISPYIVIPHWVKEFDKAEWKSSFGEKIAKIKATTLETAPSKMNDSSRLQRMQLTSWYNNEENNKIMVMSYEMFNSLIKKPDKKIMECLQNPGPDLLIFDEGHRVKNRDLKSYEEKDKIITKRRIILTGTPMQNNLKELYAVVNYVDKTILGPFEEFDLRYIKPVDAGKCSDDPEPQREQSERIQTKLFEKLKSVMHRKDESYLKDILECTKKEITITFKETPKQRLLLNYITKKYTEQLKNFFQYRHDLNQIAAHPFIYQKKKVYISPDKDVTALQAPKKSVKMIFFFEILDECIRRNEKVVVFAEYLETLDYIENQLKSTTVEEKYNVGGQMYKKMEWKKGVTYYRIDGKTDNFKRETSSEEFNEKVNTDARLFLLSTNTASVGISLIGATRMILFDHGFNPANNTQAVYRIYRLGQTRNVFIYRFEIKNCDDTVLRNQITKLIQTKGVVDGAYQTPQFTKGQLNYKRNIDENQSAEQISDQRILEIDDHLLRDVIERNKEHVHDFSTYSDIFFDNDHELLEDVLRISRLPLEDSYEDELRDEKFQHDIKTEIIE